ncbi:DUF6734 family protein [Silvibacterium acidisoli]|uniref:DUF6734 family protein n=1 Tax=Acidobacteriaceae bacterium ZG23-2 TaxID=2883246 RepID=UPI00406C4738
MRAVWSFWSKPFREYKGRIWYSPLHHLLAWGLSQRAARRHHPETVLITDSAGKALLVNCLGLSFDHVSTELDTLHSVDPGWWALGKLVAYSLQDKPFVHLDTDVFLWKALPQSLLCADVFSQCPEDHPPLAEWCTPGDVEHAFERQGATLPVEWEWSRSRGLRYYREANCGIFGGNRVDFIRYYSNLAIDLVLNPEHAAAWNSFHDRSGFNMVVEQFLAQSCVDFHRSHPDSPFRGVSMRYLFQSLEEAFHPDSAVRAGFTHLLGDAKRDTSIASRIEQRCLDEDRDFYRHCVQLSRSEAVMNPAGLQAR